MGAGCASSRSAASQPTRLHKSLGSSASKIGTQGLRQQRKQKPTPLLVGLQDDHVAMGNRVDVLADH